MLLMSYIFYHATRHCSQIFVGVTHFGYPPIDDLDCYVLLLSKSDSEILIRQFQTIIALPLNIRRHTIKCCFF